MAKDFETLLDECLRRVLSGEGLEQCLARYPQEAARLEPLLRTALAVARATAIEPRPEFKARARYQLQAAFSARGQEKKRLFLLPLPRWALALSLLLALSLALGGTVVTAAGSLPGELLYPVKTATEQVQLALTPSEAPQARLRADLAERRLQEMVVITRKDVQEQQRPPQRARPERQVQEQQRLPQKARPERQEQERLKEERLIQHLGELEERLAHHLDGLERLAAGRQGRQALKAERLKALLEERLGPRLAELGEAVDRASPPTRERAQKVLEASREHYRRALQTLEKIEQAPDQKPQRIKPTPQREKPQSPSPKMKNPLKEKD